MYPQLSKSLHHTTLFLQNTHISGSLWTQGECGQAKPVLSEKQHQSQYTAGEIDFNKIIQPKHYTTKQANINKPCEQGSEESVSKPAIVYNFERPNLTKTYSMQRKKTVSSIEKRGSRQ